MISSIIELKLVQVRYTLPKTEEAKTLSSFLSFAIEAMVCPSVKASYYQPIEGETKVAFFYTHKINFIVL